jgi:hypothetical protein
MGLKTGGFCIFMSASDEVNLFIRSLSARHLEPVRHGRYLALRGERVGSVPQSVWDELGRFEPALLRLLPDEITPFRARERRPG